MRYQRIGTLGSGTGSTVYHCKDRVSNTTVALKVLNTKTIDVGKAQYEVQLLSCLRGVPGVVQLYHYFVDNTGSFCMALEKADMTLLNLLQTCVIFSFHKNSNLNSEDASGGKTFRPMSECWVRFLFSQVANAVAVIHNMNIAHRYNSPKLDATNRLSGT